MHWCWLWTHKDIWSAAATSVDFCQDFYTLKDATFFQGRDVCWSYLSLQACSQQLESWHQAAEAVVPSLVVVVISVPQTWNWKTCTFTAEKNQFACRMMLAGEGDTQVHVKDSKPEMRGEELAIKAANIGIHFICQFNLSFISVTLSRVVRN